MRAVALETYRGVSNRLLADEVNGEIVLGMFCSTRDSFQRGRLNMLSADEGSGVAATTRGVLSVPLGAVVDRIVGVAGISNTGTLFAARLFFFFFFLIVLFFSLVPFIFFFFFIVLFLLFLRFFLMVLLIFFCFGSGSSTIARRTASNLLKSSADIPSLAMLSNNLSISSTFGWFAEFTFSSTIGESMAVSIMFTISLSPVGEK
mmetsp:Transcript_17579/g.38451  ORF Transcript_17579/g.38451 Transcript_17579/m.38451 type:complete len:204 (+) Transcript_17579:480-1091(+)